MKQSYIQIIGLLITAVYFIFIAFLYLAEPRSVADITTKAASTIENVTTKGSVVIGTYQVDQARFEEGLRLFRQDNFIAARDAFQKADPERRDPATQYYIAYTFYRQGWGRLVNDDELFSQGLKQLERVNEIDPNYVSNDADLRLQRPAELKFEFEEGMRVNADDFNPMRLVRERK